MQSSTRRALSWSASVACLLLGCVFASLQFGAEARVDEVQSRVRLTQEVPTTFNGAEISLGVIHWRDDSGPDDVAEVCGDRVIGYGELREPPTIGQDEQPPARLRNDIVVLHVEGAPFCLAVGATAGKDSMRLRVVDVDGAGAEAADSAQLVVSTTIRTDELLNNLLAGVLLGAGVGGALGLFSAGRT
ncbi:hypothetical protein ACI78V_18250 [Geodermatophilus sp. SYSU D00742]